jgi:hypothetical protein
MSNIVLLDQFIASDRHSDDSARSKGRDEFLQARSRCMVGVKSGERGFGNICICFLSSYKYITNSITSAKERSDFIWGSPQTPWGRGYWGNGALYSSCWGRSGSDAGIGLSASTCYHCMPCNTAVPGYGTPCSPIWLTFTKAAWSRGVAFLITSPFTFLSSLIVYCCCW